MTINHNHTARTLVLATDGSCLRNPGPGGWAVVIHEQYGDAVVSRSALAGRADGHTTNNQQELQAAIEALKYSASRGLPATVITDSQYVQRGMVEWLPTWKANGWRTADRKKVKNREQWEELDRLVADQTVTWQWVKAHNGHLMNEAADRLANDAAWGLVDTQDQLRHFHRGLFLESPSGDLAA